MEFPTSCFYCNSIQCKEKEDDNGTLFVHRNCFWFLYYTILQSNNMKFFALLFFLVAAPFNEEKKTATMHCLHIIVVFSFVVMQLYNKEDDDMRFSISSFFLLQRHLV
jgi:hypothetical protein